MLRDMTTKPYAVPSTAPMSITSRIAIRGCTGCLSRSRNVPVPCVITRYASAPASAMPPCTNAMVRLMR
jgi:hypothetical protein